MKIDLLVAYIDPRFLEFSHIISIALKFKIARIDLDLVDDHHEVGALARDEWIPLRLTTIFQLQNTEMIHANNLCTVSIHQSVTSAKNHCCL